VFVIVVPLGPVPSTEFATTTLYFVYSSFRFAVTVPFGLLLSCCEWSCGVQIVVKVMESYTPMPVWVAVRS